MPRTVLATLIATGSVLATAACGPSVVTPADPGSAPAAGTWTRLPDSPLSPREGGAVAHVATPGSDLAVFIGGYVGPPCPPNADCDVPAGSTASDGAALDLETGTWRTIAEAPRPVASYSSAAVIGDTVYVLTERHLLVWDASDDAWTELDPPTRPAWGTLVADTEGDAPRLIVTGSSDEYGVQPDQVWDPVTGTWSGLPTDPLRPSFDRYLVPTSAGLVLTAKPIGRDGGPADPALVHAAVLPPGAQEWRALPRAEDQLGGWYWTWTGTRLVDLTLGGADGGEVDNYGRTIPYGGALDPATGAWSPLEGTPDELTGGWTVDAVGGRYSAVQGWIYDDGDAAGDGRGWSRLDRPEGAPPQPGRAVWAGDVLVVSGGADWDGPDEPDEWTPENVWSTGAWAYRVR
jgi:hypothetical protein